MVMWTKHGNIPFAWGMIVCSVVLPLLCWGVVLYTSKRGNRKTLRLRRVERADDKVLQFLIAYLLPVFSGIGLEDLAASVTLTCYSLFLIAAVVVHGNAYHFNPTLALFGYKFYQVTTIDDVEYLLLSKRKKHGHQWELTARRIGEYIYIETRAAT